MQPEPSRRFQWVSSQNGPSLQLEELNRRMLAFYTRGDTRDIYESELVAAVACMPGSETPRGRALAHILARQPATLLEIGCSSGRGFRQLSAKGFTGDYTGMEPSAELIAQNRRVHPAATWVAASVYDLPFGDASFEMIYSEYVLEHLVYPVKALHEIARVLRPSGEALLLFPDFQCSGRMGSQMLGFSNLSAREKLRRLRILDFLVSVFDSRLRLPRALALARTSAGPFPVNLAPRCLRFPTPAADDYDAVYIASKAEVRQWAEDHGLTANFPAGTDGVFHHQGLISITKPDPAPKAR